MESYESDQEVSGVHIRANMDAPTYAARILVNLVNLQKYGHIRLTALGSAINKAVDIAAIVTRIRPDVKYEVEFDTYATPESVRMWQPDRFPKEVSRIIISLTGPSK